MGRQPQRRHRLIDRARALVERSGDFLDLGRYDEALESAKGAIAILGPRRAGGAIARLRHQALVHGGHVQILRGEYGDARALFARALRAAETHRLGPQALARALNGLGMAGRYRRRFPEAEGHYRRALRELDSARDAPLVATVFHNLGGLEHSRRRYARAERFARRGLELRLHCDGATAVSTATDVAALAAIVHARGRHEEAAALYRRALFVLRRRLGPGHFEVVFNRCQLAALDQARGRLGRSERGYREWLPRLERILGRDHPVVAQVAANRAALLVPSPRS